MFSGVLGGIGEYLNLNPLILRILYIILAIRSSFTMIFLYIIFSAIIPLEDDIIEEDYVGYTNSYKANNNSFLGIALVVLGIVLLTFTLLPLYFPQFLHLLRYYISRLTDFWPVLLIVLGIYLLIEGKKNKDA